MKSVQYIHEWLNGWKGRLDIAWLETGTLLKSESLCSLSIFSIDFSFLLQILISMFLNVFYLKFYFLIAVCISFVLVLVSSFCISFGYSAL